MRTRLQHRKHLSDATHSSHPNQEPISNEIGSCKAATGRGTTHQMCAGAAQMQHSTAMRAVHSTQACCCSWSPNREVQQLLLEPLYSTPGTTNERELNERSNLGQGACCTRARPRSSRQPRYHPTCVKVNSVEILHGTIAGSSGILGPPPSRRLIEGHALLAKPFNKATAQTYLPAQTLPHRHDNRPHVPGAVCFRPVCKSSPQG